MNQSTVDSNKGIFKVVVYEQEENGKVTEKRNAKRDIFKEAKDMINGKMESVSIKLESNKEIEEMTH